MGQDRCYQIQKRKGKIEKDMMSLEAVDRTG